MPAKSRVVGSPILLGGGVDPVFERRSNFHLGICAIKTKQSFISASISKKENTKNSNFT
jgi:hypothetical protein